MIFSEGADPELISPLMSASPMFPEPINPIFLLFNMKFFLLCESV
jgi:hypothetical protein